MSGLVGTAGARSGILGDLPYGSIRKIATEFKNGDTSVSNSTTETTFLTYTFSPDGGVRKNTTVYGWLYVMGWVVNDNGSSGRNGLAGFIYTITGNDITDISRTHEDTIGTYGYSGGNKLQYVTTIMVPPVTLDGTGNADIVYTFKKRHAEASNNQAWQVYGNDTAQETHLTLMEVETRG